MFINFFSLLLLVGGGEAAGEELLRATWLPTSYATSEASVFDVMGKLQDLGVRRVYVDVWNQGRVFFNSTTMKLHYPPGIAADHLLWSLNAAKKLGGGMEVFAWFEYGLMCNYGQLSGFGNYANSKGWVLGKSDNFIWMDPSNEDVLRFIVGILNDAIHSYQMLGLAGVQLDDHFASPATLGRSAKDVTNAMAFLRKNLISGSVLSLSPTTLSLSLHHNVDWDAWGSTNLVDEIVPQLYYSSFSSFAAEFSHTLASISQATRSKLVGAGLRVDGTGSSTPWDDVAKSIAAANSNNVGVSVWYARGMVVTYAAQFSALWSGGGGCPSAACSQCISHQGGKACSQSACGGCNPKCLQCIENGEGSACLPLCQPTSAFSSGASQPNEPGPYVAVVPFANCSSVGRNLCYQGNEIAVKRVLELDPLICKVSKHYSNMFPGNCSDHGFSHFVSNDPVFSNVELWKIDT